MSNYVFLIDANKTPMNPIHPTQARKLMEAKKAAVFRRYPFTLIMNRVVENIVTYPLTLKIDPGSKTTGISLVTNRNEVIWGLELEHRGQQIKDALDSRRSLRRGRRTRHTRYRQARFLNRTRPKGWLAPSLRHRVLTTETWVKRICKFAPVATIFQELVRFDLQQMENPEISGVEYQQGTLAGYEVREYLLEKWVRKCTYCSKEAVPLQVEHIQPRAKGGSDRISNLCLACEPCNQRKGTQDLKDFLKGKPDLASRILKQAKAPLKDAAAVNSTRWVLFSTLKETGLPVSVGSGGQTKFNRHRMGLPKAHWIDAACVGDVENLGISITQPLLVKSSGQGHRQFTRTDKYGFPCAAARQKVTHCRTGDIVQVNITKPRKQFVPGLYTGRIKGVTEKSADVQIGKFRIIPEFSYVKFLHKQDGYRYV